jgi:RNAse (barnase) inhibitor barstar
VTIDERLEKLTERHEALAQTMELMAAENRDRDARWDKQMGEVMEGIARLLHIAEIHEQRIERLEGEQG